MYKENEFLKPSTLARLCRFEGRTARRHPLQEKMAFGTSQLKKGEG